MIYSFAPQALEEFDAAARYYEAQEPGLGVGFVDEVEAAIQAVVSSPLSGRSCSKRLRRYLLHRFPFVLMYVVVGEEIRILAVAHTRRRPGYWRGRR